MEKLEKYPWNCLLEYTVSKVQESNRQTSGFVWLTVFRLLEHLLDADLKGKYCNGFHLKCLPGVYCLIALQTIGLAKKFVQAF